MPPDIAVIKRQPAMMFSGTTPWQGLGKELKQPATAAEAIQQAQLDWGVVKVPIHIKRGKRYQGITNRFATVREDALRGGEPVALGIVGSTYKPLQNEDAFRWFDPIVGQGAAVYQTAGALGNGEQVWILAKLPEPIRIVGDDIAGKFLLLSNSHDGTSSVRVKFAPIRFACWNSLMLPSGGKEQIRIKHTSRLQEQMAVAQQNLGFIQRQFSEIEQAFRGLVRINLDELRLAKYLCAVFPTPLNPKDSRALRYITKARSQSRYLFEMGNGNSCGATCGTLWAAYNGVAEFIDYATAAGGLDQHLDSIWFGGGYYTKARAYRIALEKALAWRN